MTHIRPMALLMFVAVVPVIIFGGFFGYYVLSQQRTAYDRQIADQARTLAVAIDRELSTQIQLLSILSESPRLDPPLAVRNFSEIARRLQARIPSWDLLRVTDLKGNVLMTSPPRPTRSVADPSSLEELVKTGSPVIGDMSRGAAGNLGFPVRVPVTREGRILLALTAVIRPAAIEELIRRHSGADGWNVWVTDASGVVAGSSNASFAIGEPETSYVTRGPDGGDTLPTGEILRSSTVAVGKTGWAVHVGMPLTEYTAGSWKTSLLLVVTCLATLGFSGAALFLFMREVAQRRAQEATVENAQRMDALGKLTGQVAHDFNNLLMIFHGGASAILRRPDDVKRTQQVMNGMLEGVARGKEMTQRLLSFSRRSNQTAEVTDLLAVLQDVKPLLRQAANDSITIDYAVSPDLWKAEIEAKSLEIALINLVTNAREAMPEGGQITIGGRNVIDAAKETHGRLRGAFTAMTVTDTGQGIDPMALSRIFEPLYSTKSGGGPGLGLTQVKNFAERSGGAVLVSSIPMMGTIVSIYLPRADGKQNPEEVLVPPGTMPRRLLIVDDTPASLEAARLSLEGEAVEVLTARSGHEALDVLRDRADVDGMLSDIMMPGMSGIELAETVQRLRPDMRIVLMTGYSDRMEQGLKVDFPVVSKPFSRLDIAKGFSHSVSSNIIQMFPQSS